VRLKPIPEVTAEWGIKAEHYRWLEGHRDMWSLFGGSKRFRSNFSMFDGAVREAGIEQIDSKEISTMDYSVKYEGNNLEELFASSFWDAGAELEWAPGEWNDDFFFTKYQLSFVRHQRLSRESGLIINGYYGGSDRPLPLQRKFFLGGLGTLHGYEHKEYGGSEFWLGKIEYGIKFPNSDMVGWVFYNVGQIAEEPVSLGDSETHHSIGLGLSFGEDLKMLIGKRLDRADVSPNIYIRFQNLFD